MTSLAQNEIEVKVNNNQESINGLRKMADFLEANPDFPALYSVMDAHVIVTDQKGFSNAAKMLRTCKKTASDNLLRASREFSKNVRLDVIILRDRVCKRVVVGTKPIVKTVLRDLNDEERAFYDSLFVKKTVEESVVEWKCPGTIVLAQSAGEEVKP